MPGTSISVGATGAAFLAHDSTLSGLKTSSFEPIQTPSGLSNFASMAALLDAFCDRAIVTVYRLTSFADAISSSVYANPTAGRHPRSVTLSYGRYGHALLEISALFLLTFLSLLTIFDRTCSR